MLETISNQKIYIDKLSEFEAFKNKTDNILISHELRIKNSIDEVIFLRDKYHQIISENLTVPGYVGTSCKFKNLSQYLLNNIAELNKIKSNKDEGRKELKELITKYENVMKSMINLNDKSIERCKDYSNSIKQDTIVIVQNKLKEYDTKNFELKTQICKDKSLNELKFKEFDEKLEESKKELNNTFNDKINEILQAISSLNENLEKNSSNIQKNMNDIQNINTNINEIKLDIRDIISNIKSYSLTQALNSKVASPIFSPRKNIQKIIVRNDNVVKEYATDSSKISNIIKSQNNNYNSNNNEINNSNNNANNNTNNIIYNNINNNGNKNNIYNNDDNEKNVEENINENRIRNKV
jgi:DNA repair exonuclease SbcCD ATPase subunit